MRDAIDVLALSAEYQPVAKVSWQKAITLLITGRIEVIEEYAISVASPSVSFNIPAVIRYLKSGYFQRRVKPTKYNIFLRDGGRCAYCGKILTYTAATKDHVKPKSKSGPHAWDNLVIACGPCNVKKGSKSLQEAGMKLLYEPYVPAYATDIAPFALPNEVPPAWEIHLEAFKKKAARKAANENQSG